MLHLRWKVLDRATDTLVATARRVRGGVGVEVKPVRDGTEVAAFEEEVGDASL